jgi:aarF domain-containing kinase
MCTHVNNNDLTDTMNSAKEELGLECDYVYEAKCQTRYREMMQPYSNKFYVPAVIEHLSTKRVITTEMVTGIAIDRLAIGASHEQPAEVRDRISVDLIELCLVELFIYRFMQTDPNWSNFLYNPDTGIINLIDFVSVYVLTPNGGAAMCVI